MTEDAIYRDSAPDPDMIRSFLAITLPDDIADALSDLQDGVKNARWVPEENFHITLVFLGDCDRRQLEDLHTGLAQLKQRSFDLQLAGTKAFGSAKPRALYADVVENTELRALQTKCERLAREAGIAVETRKFVPHVTLARCGGGVIPAQAIEWTVTNNLFRTEPFDVHGFSLVRSELSRDAPVYTEMAHYPCQPLEAGRVSPDT